MVVRLDLESDGESIADIDDAGVLLPCPDKNFGRFCGKELQDRARIFVGAVFAPHDGEDAEFGVARLAAKDVLHAPVFVGREVMFLDQFGRYRGLNHRESSFQAGGRPIR